MLPDLSTLRFASDATIAAIWGGGLLMIAAFSIWAEVRRIRRKRIDQVGWVPWTKVFVITAFVGVTLLAMALKGWLAG